MAHPGTGSGESGQGEGSESGGQDRQEGTEEGNRESGTGTGSGEEDGQRQGDVAHEGDLGVRPENSPGSSAQNP